ncbi:hypothetical protein N9J56_01235 [Pelagibacteraceae bacterium]|nr:hypothetical protein [Pelagibacteraceae bacterium]
MSEQKLRLQRIIKKLNLDKLPPNSKNYDVKELGATISEFIHHVFIERKKSDPLNWCFANIKRIKIFLQIFHANQSGKQIYKEEIAKNLSEYSYKTIAKIIDDGIMKNHFVLLPADGVIGKDTKVKNIRPSEELIVDFLNLSLEIISYSSAHKL